VEKTNTFFDDTIKSVKKRDIKKLDYKIIVGESDAQNNAIRREKKDK